MNLPTQARLKLESLENATSDARAQLYAAKERVTRTEQELAEATHELRVTPEAKEAPVILRIDELTARLEAARESMHSRSEKYRATSRILAEVAQFLEGNHRKNFELAPAPKVSKSATLASIRQAISETKAKLTTAKQSRLDNDTLKAQAGELVKAFAARGAPILRVTDSLDLAPQDGYPSNPRLAAWYAIAWVDPSAFLKAIERDIDALPSGGLSPEDKAKVVDEMTASLDALERTEEALIEQALTSGQLVQRRSDASPLAILGIRQAKKKAQAA